MIVKSLAMKASAAILVGLGMAMVAVPANAATTDLEDVGTAVTGGFNDLLGFFGTYIIPAIFLITIAVIGLRWGVRWLKRSAN